MKLTYFKMFFFHQVLMKLKEKFFKSNERNEYAYIGLADFFFVFF